MGRALAAAVCLVLADVAASTACALVPLRRRLADLQQLAFWESVYSPGDSNLDIWLLSLGHAGLFLMLLMVCLSRDTSYSLPTRRRQYQRLQTASGIIAAIPEVTACNGHFQLVTAGPPSVVHCASRPVVPA